MHSDHLWGAVPSGEFSSYVSRRSERQSAANRHWLEFMHARRPLVAIKSAAPYTDADMPAVFLSPLARATRNDATGAYQILSAAPRSSGAGGAAALQGDRSRLNLALRSMSKSISWRNLRASPSSQFLHVDSHGSIHSQLASPRSGSSSASQLSDSSNASAPGHTGQSRNGSMARSESVVWSAPAAHANQNLNTEVGPAGSSASSSLSRADSEAALNQMGLTHSLSGVNLTSAAQEADSDCGVGVDVEETSTFENRDAAFLERNFTAAERAYCAAQPHPAASYAGKWAAKEATLKALSQLYSSTANASASGLAGAAAPLIDIEVLAPAASASGQTLAPVVTLRGAAERLAQHLNLATIQLSISHSGSHALSLAMARSRPHMQSIRSVADLSALIKK